MNILSNNGMEVLNTLYQNFRQSFVDQHPGCNENDVERRFLHQVFFGLNGDHFRLPKAIGDKIADIR